MEDNSNKEIQPNNILHGVGLRQMLVYLVKELGWEKMGEKINIKCFTNNPSMGSSLTFLKRTTWAKNAVQQLYVNTKNKVHEPIVIAYPKTTIKKSPTKNSFTEKERFSKKDNFSKDSKPLKSLDDFIKKHKSN